MKRIAVTLVLALALPAAALADPPQRITIVSVFDPITFGEKAYVNGQLVADDESMQANQPVTLQEAPFPFGTWADVAQTTTDYQGYYSFKREPSLTTHYRTVWNGQVTSEKEVRVQVAPRITLTVVPAGRKTLRYSGTFAPAIDGQRISLQRRARDGSWTTIATPALHGGKTFGGRLRAKSPAILRAFYPTDGAHLDGYSRVAKGVPRR